MNSFSLHHPPLLDAEMDEKPYITKKRVPLMKRNKPKQQQKERKGNKSSNTPANVQLRRWQFTDRFA